MRRVSTRMLLLGGAVGPPLFVVVLLIEGATRQGYSAWRHYGSQLATGEGGWVQVVNFIVYGLLILGFAAGLRRALGSSRAAAAAPVLVGVYGLALVVAGIFVTDPALGYPPGVAEVHTTHGLIHGLAGLATFSFLTAACIAMTLRFARDPSFRGFGSYSLFTAVLIPVCFILSNVFAVLDAQGSWPNAPTGFVQRIAIVGGWAWIAVLAVRLLREAPHPRGESLSNDAVLDMRHRR